MSLIYEKAWWATINDDYIPALHYFEKNREGISSYVDLLLLTRAECCRRFWMILDESVSFRLASA